MKTDRLLIFGLVLAALVRAALFIPELRIDRTRASDAPRFFFQAEQLRAGQGFLDYKLARDTDYQVLKPTTGLPPGYPVFVALLTSVWNNAYWIIAVQFVISLASVALVYRAVRPAGRAAAGAAMLVMAGSPWIAAFVPKVMSETLGVFLASVTAWLISRSDPRDASTLKALAIGMLCSSLILTLPSMLFVAGAIGATMVWTHRRRPAAVAAMVLGAATVMAPWQWHCVQATGGIVPTIYTTDFGKQKGFYDWTRAWTLHESEFMEARASFWVDAPGHDGSDLPDRAFTSTADREKILRQAAAWRQSRAGEPERDAFFAPIAAAREADSTAIDRWTRVALRAAFMWLDMPSVWRFSQSKIADLWPARLRDIHQTTTATHAARRALEGGASLMLWIAHAAITVLLAWAAWKAVRSGSIMPLAILAGVAMYSVMTGHTGFMELRRNLPFIPLLLLLMLWGARPAAAPLDTDTRN